MKKKKRLTTDRRPLTSAAKSPLGKLADDLDALRTRQVAIQKRLGVIGAQSTKLYAEQHGIELKRAAKQREFDAISGL